MVDQSLNVLVRQFVYDAMPYEEFRGRFVANFLSVRRSPQSPSERDVNAIEHVCADFDEGDIGIDELRDDLSALMLSESGSSAALMYRAEFAAA